MFLPSCGRISFPFPAPYRSAKPVSATCGLQSRSIWTAHRSQTAGSMQIVPISTQNGDPICKPSGTSRSSRRESGKSTMFLFPKMPYPPASVPCGSRSRSFSTGCRPKRTSSLLRTSVPAPVCSSTSSPPSLSPPSSCGSTIDSHHRGRLWCSKNRKSPRKKVQPDKFRLHLLFPAKIPRQLLSNLIPTYQAARTKTPVR